MQTTQNQGDSRTNKFGLLVRSHCVSRGRSRNASSANSPKISVLKFDAFSLISSTTVLAQRSERWMYRSAGPNWRIQVNSSGYLYLSGKRCNTILKFRTSGTRYSSRRLRVPLVRKHSQFYSLSSVTLFWRQKLN